MKRSPFPAHVEGDDATRLSPIAIANVAKESSKSLILLAGGPERTSNVSPSV